MKITDLAILSGAVIVAMLSIWNIKTDMLWYKMEMRRNINDVMDEAVRDVLDKSFIDTNIEGEPIIDKEGITDALAKEAAYICYGNMHEESIRKIKGIMRACFLIEKDVMYVYEYGEYVREIVLDTETGGFGAAATAAMESVIGTKLLLPYNDGEDDIQKIGEYSYTAITVRNGEYIAFSSACIKDRIS